MPDHLSRPGPSAYTTPDEADAELTLEKAWLASSIRCFLDDGCGDKSPKAEVQYRLPTCWWLVMVDSVLRSRTGQGLEAFSSHATVDEVRKLLTDKQVECLPASLQDLCRSARWPWQWLGPRSGLGPAWQRRWAIQADQKLNTPEASETPRWNLSIP